jgi:hypothetical protein
MCLAFFSLDYSTYSYKENTKFILKPLGSNSCYIAYKLNEWGSQIGAMRPDLVPMHIILNPGEPPNRARAS